MSEWLVRLAGRERDLRFLATTLRDPWRVTEEGGRFYLRSGLFQAFGEAGEVKHAADEMIDRVNLVTPLHCERYGCVSTGEVWRVNADGTRGFAVAFSDGLAVGEATVVGFAAANGSSSVADPPDLNADVALLKQRTALAEALRYVRDEPDWPGYYKAFEAVRDAAGGEPGLSDKGWATKPLITRFTRSAQPHRHHRYHPTLPNPMTEAEGRAFVLDLLRRWVDWERSRRKR